MSGSLREHRERKAVKSPCAQFPLCSEAALGSQTLAELVPSHQQATSCCVPGKATELPALGEPGPHCLPQGPLPTCKAPPALQFSSIKKNSPKVLCNFDSAQV